MSVSYQRGNIIVILIGAIALVVASYFWQQSRLAAAKSETERLALAAKQATEQQAQIELKALQQQIEAAKPKDILETSIKAASDLYARWKDAIQIAQRTSRVGLATPVATLQALKREAEGLIVPDCLKNGKTNLLEAMKLEIEGFLAFMGDVNFGKYVAQANSQAAEKLLVGFDADISMCPKQ